jgi:thiamine-phosphate pyrophosphorylase
MKAISKLHFITTNAAAAEQACAGGANWIQLRLKNVSYDEHLVIARQVQAVCRQYRATFIINDNVSLAKEVGADGVHIGKEDMRPDKARELLGAGSIIGCTANTADDIIHLSRKPIDYIGLGPYRFTATKNKLSPLLGLKGYARLFKTLKEGNVKHPPVIGIGGITESDVTELMSTGLHGIAVSGSIANAKNISEAAKNFTRLLSEKFSSVAV